jgi:tetratricopeptide (TPR) repeat protein
MPTTTTLTSMISRMRKRAHASAVCALGLIALASAGCSKAEPTRDELLARANDHVSAREYDKAEKEYREVLRLMPADPDAIRQLGMLYQDQGQLPQAYALLQKAAELQPDDADLQTQAWRKPVGAG